MVMQPKQRCFRGLAYSVGYKKLADVLTISMKRDSKVKYALAVNKVADDIGKNI